MCLAVAGRNDVDNLEELESNPIFLCMQLQPGRAVEFPVEVPGTAPYMFQARRLDDSEFVEIRPTIMFRDQREWLESLQKHYWKQAQAVAQVFLNYKETFVIASLMAGLHAIGESLKDAKTAVYKYKDAYKAARIHVQGE